MPNTLKNMTNYEELCTMLDIMKQPNNYYYTGAVWHYPLFDEKKQIALIKIICRKKSLTFAHYEEYKRNIARTAVYNCMANNFAEALAGLALQLIKAGELNKEAVRKVFE